MQVTLRLYDQIDPDLVWLKLRYRKKFPSMIRGCLLSHLNGGDYTINFSGPLDTWAKRPEKPMCVNLNLNPVRDADVIEFLKDIRDFAKSDVIKTIVRSRYSVFPSFLFLPPYVGGGNHDASHLLLPKKPLEIMKGGKKIGKAKPKVQTEEKTDIVEKEEMKKENDKKEMPINNNEKEIIKNTVHDKPMEKESAKKNAVSDDGFDIFGMLDSMADIS